MSKTKTVNAAGNSELIRCSNERVALAAVFYVHGGTVCRNCQEQCFDDVHGGTVCRNCRGDNGLSKCQQFGVATMIIYTKTEEKIRSPCRSC